MDFLVAGDHLWSESRRDVPVSRSERLSILSKLRRHILHSVLPETLRTIVGDGSITPPFLNARPIEFIRQRRLHKTPLDKASRLPLEYQHKLERKKVRIPSRIFAEPCTG